MSQIDKLLQKLNENPKDLKFSELARIFKNFGYMMAAGGKTSGSSITFRNAGGDKFTMHKPHPGDELKPYAVRSAKVFLKERGLI